MNKIDHIFHIKSDNPNLGLKNDLYNYGFRRKITEIKDINWQDKYSGFVNGFHIANLESQLIALKLTMNTNYTNILIIEDEFNFIMDKDNLEYTMYQFFQQYENNYDILLLTYDDSNMNTTDCNDIFISCDTYNIYTAYIIHRNAIPKYIKALEEALQKLISTQEYWNYGKDIIFNSLLSESQSLFIKEIVGIRLDRTADIFSYLGFEDNNVLDDIDYRDYIDQVFYINSSQNFSLIEEELTKLDFSNLKINRLTSSSNKYSGFIYGKEIANTESHLSIIKTAKKNNYENVAIFEDTFKFIVDDKSIQKNLNYFFEKYSNDFAVLMLAYNVEEHETLDELVGTSKKVKNTIGYIVNESVYDELIKIYEHSLERLINTQEVWNYKIDILWLPLQKKTKWFYFRERMGGAQDILYNNKIFSYFSDVSSVSENINCGPGTTGLILYPDGTTKWLNNKAGHITSQVSYNGPIVMRIKELVKKQNKTVIIPFCDEEPFYLNEWLSPAPASHPKNMYTWVRKEPIIDIDKYNLYKEQFGDNFIILTVSLFFGKPSFPQVKTIPWSDEIYQTGPYTHFIKNSIPSIPFKEKLDKVVWRGCNFDFHIHSNHPRLMISDVLKKYSWANVMPNRNGWYYSGIFAEVTTADENYLPPKEQCKYKAILYIDGQAGATSEKWLFLSGSVVIKIARWESCMIQKMRPWYDFVPVKWDLSDLVENIQWVFNNPLDAEKIANQGRETFIKYTSREELDKVILSALD